MTWLPQFLSWQAGAIAAVLTIPPLLLLYFLKLRRREMAVSSTFLWRKAVQDLQVNSPSQRLRKNLLLLLQLLCLLALILALARPVVNSLQTAGKLSVILIDRSASMAAHDMPGGRSRLGEAKRQADDLVSSMANGSQATVIAFDDQPEIVQTFSGDAVALKRAIDGIVQSDRPTKMSMAYQLAQAQSVAPPEGMGASAGTKPEVWLYSDGRALDPNDLRLDGTLKYQKIGTDTAHNIAVVAMEARRAYEQPTQVQVFARLANYGPKPVTADVRLTVDNNLTKVNTVELIPERWSDPAWVDKHPGEKDEKISPVNSVQFTFDMPQAGIVKVEQMNKTDDQLPADDAAAVVVPPPKALSVLLVTTSHDNPFVENTFNHQGLKDTRVMLSDTYEDDHGQVAADDGASKYDVIIYDRYYPTWTPQGASQVYIGCAPREGRLHVISDKEVYQSFKGAIASDWAREDDIMRYISMNNLYAASVLKLATPPEAQVLVDSDKGPMIVVDRQGRGTKLVVAFDVLQSNWPIRPSFPLFLHNALQSLALGADMNVRASLKPGSTPKIARTVLDKMGPTVKSITLVAPDGDTTKLPVPPTGDLVFPALGKVGVYKTDPPVPQFEQIAVNLLDASESNLMPVEAPPGKVGEAVAVAAGKSRLELWWWLVAACAIPLLLIEWFVYTRRVHL